MAGSNTYDVVVIGGGHNGLVNSAYLATRGQESSCARAAPCSRRGRLYGRDRPGLQVLGFFLRRVVASAGNHSRP